MDMLIPPWAWAKIDYNPHSAGFSDETRMFISEAKKAWKKYSAEVEKDLGLIK